jgi:hypothetical protein
MQKFPFFFVFCSKIGGKMKKHLKKLAWKKKLVFVFWKFFLSKHSFRSVCLSFGTIGRTKSFKPFKKSQKKIFRRRPRGGVKNRVFWKNFSLFFSLHSNFSY